MTALTRSPSEPSSAARASTSAAAFAAVHPDVLLTHILSRLDGPTLATASCVSSSLYSLISSDDALWRAACAAAFPSTASHPRLRRVISSHRSFFADSFPFPHNTKTDPRRSNQPPPRELISAVDIHYAGDLVFSRVLETKTASSSPSSSSWLKWAPFRLDGLDRGESVELPVRFSASDGGACVRRLEEDLTVSWIVVDPARGRAANLSSRRAVSAKLWRRWTSSAARDVEVRYATVVAGGGEREPVECAVVVTCGGKEGGAAHVREVSVLLEDMDGRHLSGEESLAILGEAMESGRRSRMGSERERYEEYELTRRERRERRERTERLMDMATMALGFSIFCALWFFLLIR